MTIPTITTALKQQTQAKLIKIRKTGQPTIWLTIKLPLQLWQKIDRNAPTTFRIFDSQWDHGLLLFCVKCFSLFPALRWWGRRESERYAKNWWGGKKEKWRDRFPTVFFFIIQRTRLSRSLGQAKNISATRFTYGTRESLIYDLLFMYYVHARQFSSWGILWCGVNFIQIMQRRNVWKYWNLWFLSLISPFLWLVRSLTILDSRSSFPKY